MIFRVTLNLEYFETNVTLGGNVDGEAEMELSLEIVQIFFSSTYFKVREMKLMSLERTGEFFTSIVKKMQCDFKSCILNYQVNTPIKNFPDFHCRRNASM